MNTELHTYLGDALYDMVDVALKMKGYSPGSVNSDTYPRVILTEIEYARRGLRNDGIDRINQKKLIQDVSKRLRGKNINRTSLVSDHFQRVAQELIEKGILGEEQVKKIARKKMGYQRKIALLLAMERNEHDKETLEPGF